MNWVDEDPELLHATLFMLAELDDAGAASPVASTSDNSVVRAPPVSVAPAPRLGPVQNPSRDRRCSELRYLRAKVDELEAQLTELQRRRDDRRHTLEDSADLAGASAASAWAGIAMRQRGRRQEAVLRNARLRNELEMQVRIARELAHAMEKAVAQQRSRSSGGEDLYRSMMRSRLAIDVCERISEEEQLQHMRDMYEHTEERFTTCARFSEGAATFLDILAANSESDDMILDVYASWVLPFGVDAVEEALWQLMLRDDGEMEGHAFVQEAVVVDDTMIAVFKATSQTKHLTGEFTGKLVAKRFRRRDAPNVIALTMYSEPQSVWPAELNSILLHEDTWMRVVETYVDGDPKAGDTNAATTPLSLVQLSRRHRITMLSDDTPAETRTVGALSEYLMDQIKGEMESMQQAMESLLLQ